MSTPHPELESARTIPGFPDYIVTWTGRVISFRTPNANDDKARELKPRRSTQGYLRIRLRSDDGSSVDFLVHDLVARTFLGPRPPGARIRHIDGNKLNNSVINLMYVTPADKFARRQHQHEH